MPTYKYPPGRVMTLFPLELTNTITTSQSSLIHWNFFFDGQAKLYVFTCNRNCAVLGVGFYYSRQVSLHCIANKMKLQSWCLVVSTVLSKQEYYVVREASKMHVIRKTCLYLGKSDSSRRIVEPEQVARIDVHVPLSTSRLR